VEAKVAKVGRLLPKATEARVVLALERHRHLVQVTLQAKGATLHAEAAGPDFQAGLDRALEALVEQARRRKERLRTRKPRPARAGVRRAPARAAVPTEDGEPAAAPAPQVVVRRVGAKPMSVDEALDQMQLARRDWLVFRNARSRVVNVLRRRPDGVVELVEPGA
jgi:putative sigma-54 modulation protein